VTVLQSDAELLTFFTQEPADLNSTSEALPEAWARWQVFGQAAQARDNGILNFISTGNAARDMLGMTEALGQEKLQYYGGSCVKKFLRVGKPLILTLKLWYCPWSCICYHVPGMLYIHWNKYVAILYLYDT